MRRGADLTGRARRATVAMTVLLMLTGLAAAPAGGQARTDPAPEADGGARAIARTVMAAGIADWARERRDPQALVVAARMLDDIPIRHEGDDPPFLTVPALLAEAEAMAGSEPEIRAQILRLRTQAKGVRASSFGAGPVVLVRRVQPRQTFGFEITARQGEVLRVAAIGDGDTNIDLVLRDRAGTVVCSDSSQDHYPVCTIIRPRGGPLRVEVVNRGTVWSRVQILTN